MVFTCHCEYGTKLSKATGGEFVHEQLVIYPLLDLPAWTVQRKSESGPVACLSFSAAGISPYSEGIRFVKLFRHRLERKTTLWPDKILSGITDSNGPCPETAKT